LDDGGDAHSVEEEDGEEDRERTFREEDWKKTGA
jgi:hypothetical protein